ncbi:ead/Ea22-like family protein [Escherichia coli]|uniref:ead/Ea22-like family protein n=1 Tax=Escherichia coli TaxID=562 RepID=UPI0002A338F2|nr:ead/Ea22-like family protein [Escherichia coli]ELF65496.1 hypothetical protein WGK_03083 [Escherichia coli KTE45]ELF96256.1 hypothetical protein A1S1_02445 [Escherichia coli KTE46]
MSELYYQTLRERFSPKPAPKCSVCGEEMSMQRISGSHVVYACSGMEDDGCFKTGRTYADEHYKKSRITVVDDSDPDVIELLEENMEMALTLEKLRVELEAAEKRIAELEAEPVSNSDELPLDYLQGHKDGLEWAAQLAEANHPQTGDWLYDDPIDLARAIRKGPDMPTVQAGNYPVTPDGWISCSERMPAQDDWILIYSKHGEYMAGQVQGEYVELSDGTLSWLGNALYWMPLPEPPQEVN